MNQIDLRHRPAVEEINALPLRAWTGEVHIIRNQRQWLEALPRLCQDGIIGFDTETKPAFRRGVVNKPAIIQLAGPDLVCIIQLKYFQFGSECVSLLADARYRKVGVGIREDMSALARLKPFEAASIIDLGDLARLNDLPNHGLRTLAASFFGWRISKGPQCSNWNAAALSARQIAYAATDAWIGRLIYLRMLELGLAAPENAD